MAQTSYIFDDTADARELERLQAIEAIFDGRTQELLAATGEWPGFSCLEVGAGAGSVAAWMKSRVGPKGRVVAVDINVRFLERFAPEIEIVRGDACELPLPAEAFDVIHARYVLIHNARATFLADALLRCLKPGGWLLLEEPDFSTAQALTGTVEQQRGFANVARAVEGMFAGRGMDYSAGRKLAALMQERKLELVSVDCETHLEPGASPLAKMMELSTLQLESKYIATGSASHEDIAAYVGVVRDPACWATYYTTFRVLGKKAV